MENDYLIEYANCDEIGTIKRVILRDLRDYCFAFYVNDSHTKA